MDKDLKNIINESLDQFFESAPMKKIMRGTREENFDICPHCKQEIYEKHEYTEDGGKTWRHSDCKGLIQRLDENVAGLPPSGEEKYYKQEPGGTMVAVNVNETSNVKTAEETKIVPARNGIVAGAVKFHDGGMTILNVFLPDPWGTPGAILIMGILIVLWLEFPAVWVHDILIILGLGKIAAASALINTNATGNIYIYAHTNVLIIALAQTLT